MGLCKRDAENDAGDSFILRMYVRKRKEHKVFWSESIFRFELILPTN